MAKDANCSSQSTHNNILIPSTITWKYIQDDELAWKLIVNEVAIEGRVHFLFFN